MSWTLLDQSGTTQLLTKLSKLAAIVVKLELAHKLDQGRRTIAMMRRSHEITNDRHESDTRRSEKKE